MTKAISTFIGIICIYTIFGYWLFGVLGCGEFDGNNHQPAVEVTPEPTIEPTIQEPTNPRCTDVMGKDGANGFLWKPQSESTGKLVVLFPAKFQRNFETVMVYPKKGGSESLDCYGRTNGDRLTCRGKLPGGRYTGLVTALDVDQVCEWKISNSKERND